MEEQLISDLEKLARLQLDGEERNALGNDLQKILDMVDRLRQLNTDHVAPLVYLSEGQTDAREDEVEGQLDTRAALKNAPLHDEQFFRVPKVIE
ncbi:MAG TPA: Asp-tRNA(Asn)/Glu-tRNA(Gln) amidotransferase subunit GatC [Saprospiraceae bacterium]|nr:Asp-tRNA(Asn)/Glu-tRNA(Gln) amidotransferase subunit GatC [Saprospiraceae bacterium]